MSLWSDYEDDYDAYVSGTPDANIPTDNGADTIWTASSGDIRIGNMSEKHIRNCMHYLDRNEKDLRDECWYKIFGNELARRGITI